LGFGFGKAHSPDFFAEIFFMDRIFQFLRRTGKAPRLLGNLALVFQSCPCLNVSLTNWNKVGWENFSSAGFAAIEANRGQRMFQFLPAFFQIWKTGVPKIVRNFPNPENRISIFGSGFSFFRTLLGLSSANPFNRSVKHQPGRDREIRIHLNSQIDVSAIDSGR